MKQVLMIALWCFASQLFAQELFTTSKWCFGELPIIEVDSVSGISPPYSYSFNNGSFTSSSSYSPNSAGTFALTVAGGSGDTLTKNVTVAPSEPIRFTTTMQPSSCEGPGSLTVTAITGGVSPVNVTINGIPTTTTSESGRLEIIATDQVGCQTTQIERITSACIRTYEGFSPNGDGLNDTWVIENIEGNDSLWVQITNRFGQVVFQSEGPYSPWDGSPQYGGSLRTGSYFYQVRPLGKESNQYAISGTLTIAR